MFVFRGNDDGITPLHQAASEGHVQCLKMLIDQGAKIDGQDCRGHTPLDLAKLWGHRKCSRYITIYISVVLIGNLNTRNPINIRK